MWNIQVQFTLHKKLNTNAILLFDRLKVETIGDAYMIVSGAPIATRYHAVRVAEMALAMKRDICLLKDPSTGQSLQIRIGKCPGWQTTHVEPKANSGSDYS